MLYAAQATHLMRALMRPSVSILPIIMSPCDITHPNCHRKVLHVYSTARSPWLASDCMDSPRTRLLHSFKVVLYFFLQVNHDTALSTSCFVPPSYQRV